LPPGRSFLLHAEKVSFSHPSTGHEIVLTCPVEDELALLR
jgi:23S rRNA-/tRNA-specific pseudouridylate synthase